MNSILWLPNEILLQIFRYLLPNDVLQLRLVCKQWAQLTSSSALKNKLCLRLDRKRAPIQLRDHIKQCGVAHLPTESLILKDLDDSEDLIKILENFSINIRCLKMKDSLVPKSLNQTDLINLEELHFQWDNRTSYKVLTDQWLHIQKYTKLKVLKIQCHNEFVDWSIAMLDQLAKMNNALPIESLSFTYHVKSDEVILEAVNKLTPTLRHLAIHFDTKLSGNENWCGFFSQLTKLETIELSGSCSLFWTKKIFENLPQSAPLHYINLDGILSTNDELMALIANKWTKKIKHLDIFFSNGIRMEGAGEIWKFHNNLEGFEVSLCKHLNIKEILYAVGQETNYTLRRLSACHLEVVDEESICLLALKLPSLEALELADCPTGVTNRSIAHIFRYQRNLRLLSIDSCHKIDDRAFEGSGEVNWPESYSMTRLNCLESLDLSNCRRLSKNFVNHFKFPNLRCLKLNNCNRIRAEAFCRIVDNCPRIEILEVSGCDGLNDEALFYIFNRLKRLLKLNIEACINISPKAISDIMDLYSLRDFSFSDPLNCRKRKKKMK